VTPRFYIRLRHSFPLMESSEIDCYQIFIFQCCLQWEDVTIKEWNKVALSDRKKHCRKPSLAAALCQCLSEKVQTLRKNYNHIRWRMQAKKYIKHCAWNINPVLQGLEASFFSTRHPKATDFTLVSEKEKIFCGWNKMEPLYSSWLSL
jgi:hypothetical protein